MMAKRCFYSIIILACILGWGNPGDVVEFVNQFLDKNTESRYNDSMSRQARIDLCGNI